jgi:hypothetical protein
LDLLAPYRRGGKMVYLVELGWKNSLIGIINIHKDMVVYLYLLAWRRTREK